MVLWTNGSRLPAIATTSLPGTPANQAGVLGQPNTGLLYGGGDVLDEAGFGARIRGGRWLNTDEVSGIGGDLLWLVERSDSFSSTSDGSSILARPFNNLANGTTPDSQIIAFPGVGQGSLAINVESRLYSAGVHYWTEFCVDECDTCSCCGEETCHNNGDRQWAFRIGPRFTHLDETFQSNEHVASLQTGTTFDLLDSFKTETSFLGGEVGLRMRQNNGNYSLDVGLNLALGANRQELDITGHSTSAVAGLAPTSAAGAFFAQQTNIGNYDRTRFALQPSFEVALGIDLDDTWRFSLGYNVLYWTNVLRVAEQVGTGMNPNLLPPVIANTGTPGPNVRMSESNYLAHGISLGFEKRW